MKSLVKPKPLPAKTKRSNRGIAGVDPGHFTRVEFSRDWSLEETLQLITDVSNKYPTIRGFIGTIQPDAAQILVSSRAPSISARKLKITVRQQIARAMLDNKWKLNGESIIFDIDGRLLDGQHRLSECATTGKPLTTFIVVGVDSNSVITHDGGGARNMNDALKISKREYVSTLAATITRLLEYDRGILHNATEVHYRPSNVEALEFIEKHPRIEDVVKRIDILRQKYKSPISTGRVVWWYYLVSRKYQRKADEFVRKLFSGAELIDGSPVHQLRERFISASKRHRGEGPNPNELHLRAAIALLTKAWNAFVKKEKPKDFKLRWNSAVEGGPETFPQLIV